MRFLNASIFTLTVALMLGGCASPPKKSAKLIETERVISSVEAFKASGKALVIMDAKAELVVNLFQQKRFVPARVQVGKDGKRENECSSDGVFYFVGLQSPD